MAVDPTFTFRFSSSGVPQTTTEDQLLPPPTRGRQTVSSWASTRTRRQKQKVKQSMSVVEVEDGSPEKDSSSNSRLVRVGSILSMKTIRGIVSPRGTKSERRARKSSQDVGRTMSVVSVAASEKPRKSKVKPMKKIRKSPLSKKNRSGTTIKESSGILFDIDYQQDEEFEYNNLLFNDSGTEVASVDRTEITKSSSRPQSNMRAGDNKPIRGKVFKKDLSSLTRFYKEKFPKKSDARIEKHCKRLLFAQGKKTLSVNLQKKFGEIPDEWESVKDDDDFYDMLL